MRIVLAYDGSPSADRALELVASLRRPPDSTVTVVTVARRERDEARLKTGRGAVTARLREEGWTADERALSGRPGDAIIDAAHDLGAELIVVGDRGHSAIGRLTLGSTAAAVADHAPCAILVARTARVERIALADDGSELARLAGEFLAESGLFAGLPVTVVTVAHVEEPIAAGLDSDPGTFNAVAAVVDAERTDLWLQGEETATRVGAPTRAVRLRGEPAAEIIRYAEEADISLIAMGTRGETGIARVFLGSVARNVLLHAPASVLVVRPPTTAAARTDPWRGPCG